MPIIQPGTDADRLPPKGKTRGVYFNKDRMVAHRALIGQRYQVERIDDEGKTYMEVYEVPEEITEFARDAVDFLLELIASWPAVQRTK
jgi:hypothetical protein